MKNKQRLVAPILLVMKLTFIQIALSVVFLTTLHAKEVNAQSILDKSFSISVQNVQLKKVISSIQKQTKVKFTFSTNAIKAQRTLTYSANDIKISEFLNDVLKTYSIGYQVVDDQVILLPIPRTEVNIDITTDFKITLDFDISGSVTNENGEPLAGVTVSEKGTVNAVVTNENGVYRISLKEESATLVFSSVGYESQEVAVQGRSSINIALKMSNKALDEVIVVGYGTQKRSDVTGAVASVPKQRLTQLPVTNVLHAIEGAVPGVTITQTSSVPGSSASILVRGQNTISNTRTAPYIVVDGIPFSSTGGVTNDINPNDIASIEILKDASATAIYGVNGSNGVILITTKRGSSGKPAIRYNGYVGLDNIIRKLEPLSPAEYVQKYAIAQAQRGLTPTNVLENAYEIANYNAGITTDWLDLVTQQGIIQNHNISVTGGSKEVKYYISGDYLKQKGAVRGYQYQRAGLRANIDATITDYLTAGTTMFYTNNNYDGGRANFYLAAAMSPYGTVYDPQGNYELYPMYPELLYTNPLLGLNTDRTDRSSNLTANIFAEVKILKGLKYRLNASKSYINTRFAGYTGRDAANTQGGAAVANNTEINSWVLENILTYNKDWGVHHIDFTGLYSAQERNYNATAINATGFINDELSANNIGAGSNISAGPIPTAGGVPSGYTGSYKYRYGLISQMVRINYTYDSRYLLTVTARRDGSSVMGRNTSKYGTFPSVAVGWNISNEKFMQSSGLVDNLKLRVSYGKSGNEAIPVYGTVTTTGTVRFPFSGASTIGVLASNLGNSNLHWETSKVFNIGVDFGIIKNRISGSIDFYSTRTEDILLTRNIPIITGYANILDNIGKTRNRGLEIQLTTENVSAKNFRWQSIINFSTNRNRIVDIYGDGRDDLGNRWFIGKPINVIYDYEMIGVWQVGEDPSQHDPGARPGDLKFKDLNNSKTITPDDRRVLGMTSPKWIGGLINNFHYKDFHLSIFIQTSQGAMKNNVTLTYADEGWRMNLPKETGYWTEQNASQERPSFRYTNSRGYNYPRDNSYTRIKDVTLSWVAPSQILSKLKLGSLTVYASGRNLYTFTDWVGWDPEHNYQFRGSGDWVNNYPITRALVFGVNLSPR